MLLAVFLLLVGALVLAVGAESAVRGATRFALTSGISPFVVGALLFGVDFEGTAAALLAAGKGATAVSAGEAYGTVIFLFSAAFGAALLVARKPVESPSVPMVIAPAVPLLASALALRDAYVSRLEGALLVALYVGYVGLVAAEGRAVRARSTEMEREANEIAGGPMRSAVVTIAGLAGLFTGAWLLVEGGLRILSRTSLAAGFVGAAVIATLASLDEVLLEVLPVRRGTPALATGNLFGTMAAFMSLVPGLAALIHPLALDDAAELAFLGAAVLYVVVAVAFVVRGRAGRLLGALVLVAYALWLSYAASI